MQPDEIVVARLNQGTSVLRYVEETKSRVTLALGRNKQAKLPIDRVIYATGIVAGDPEEVVEFRAKAEAAAEAIDLTEVWEVVADEQAAMTTTEIAELYYDDDVGPPEMVALTLHLDRGTDYFESDKLAYTPRTTEALDELRARRKREAENAEAAETLMAALGTGTLPDPISNLHENLLQHIRGYAIHGDDYARSYAAHSLLERVSSGERDLQRRAFDLLVDAAVFEEDEALELHRTEIDEQFSQDALDEAEVIASEHQIDIGKRTDLTHLEVFTIDDAETRDRDDALSLEVIDGGYRLGIHITDAGTLVPAAGPIDTDADRRMATLYLPERQIQMLPPKFTYEVGSLDPDKARFVISLLIQINEAGEVQDYEIKPSLIRSRAAISYDEVDAAIADESNPWNETLNRMSGLAQALLVKRERAGAINVNRQEMVIRVSSPTDIDVRVVERSTPSRDLVTEMMILCNSLMADYCKTHEIPASYRSQSAPDVADLDIFDDDGVLRELTRLQRHKLMRRFSPAVIGIVPTPHVGLGVDAYIQATSPLRRYPDLVMQRQISHYLSSGEPFYTPEEIASVAQRADVQLRELSRLEEGRRRYWFVKYLRLTRLEDPDATDLFTAYVLENEPRRLAMLDLDDFPYRARAELPESVEPGTNVTLKLTGTDLWRRQAFFVCMPD
jgi:exoribonuclease-2